jgi:peptide/nickel transport system permease protein
MLSRLIWGGRASIVAGLAAAAISVGIGTLLGLVAGYVRGAVDSIIMRVVDILMAFPPLILAIAIVGSLGAGLQNAVIAAGVIGIPLYARVIRGIVLVERELDYVLATEALGATGPRIMWRHVTPATSSSLVVLITLDIGYKIIITAGMSFLGLGSQLPDVDWGAMLADGRSFLSTAPHLATIPGLAIFVVVLATNLLGDGLRDALDPRISDGAMTARGS